MNHFTLSNVIMKKIILIIGITIAIISMGYSQNINWRSIHNQQKNMVTAQLGLDYGTTVQVGYFRPIRAFRPILLGADFSMPAGEDLLDDFKVRWGGMIEVYEYNGFSVTGKILANYRRNEMSLVRMQSFGSEFAIISGYYKPTWHAALELGFDKAISTHLKHTDLMKETYPDVQDGWYVPTGGNWYYGIQGSKSIGQQTDATLRLGLTNAQKDDEDSLLPFYLQLGINRRF